MAIRSGRRNEKKMNRHKPEKKKTTNAALLEADVRRHME
jgi:hypothetical protein